MLSSQTSLNIEAFKKAKQTKNPSSFPFLQKFTKDMYKKPRYKGLKILHNIPLSIETVIKLEALAISGAEVTVTAADFVKPNSQPLAEKLLKEIGIKYTTKDKIDESFDFYLDCCAELSFLPPPKKGIVELTRTGTHVYMQKNVSIPIISVDDSRVKNLETFYGTGDGCVRAFSELTNQNIENNNFLIFGFGKVGQGVAYSLKKHNASISIVDVNGEMLSLASKHGYKTINVKDQSSLIESLKSATAVITATGIKGIITKTFKDSSLFKDKILANIGAEDEFGDAFTDRDVLFNKIPINFSLEEPTLFRYLDPIFYAHNYSIDLILNRELKSGYHPFPENEDKRILNEWAKIHSEKIDMFL